MKYEVIPFLSMNGDAAEAIAFYEKTLGAKVLFRKSYKEMKEMSPEFTYPAGQDEYITHSVLQVGVNKVMIAEEAMDAERPWESGNSISMCIQSQDQEQIDRLYEELSQYPGVKVLVPYEGNEFSPGYGIVRDPFGVVIQLCVTVHDF
ncbi:VOC family protein [Paenibacillus silvae]|uniref:VOC family protein n=1 Tax=Paenibacillus silvae TaxID=1325358 RepID=UPI0020042014|nr:VOC family protein [Paenibacillus silvae]MCK6078862.1 VOC family protein [Paenibacillus silvae]MCK6153181.1 VOC family protein [Paenibacillus silvae]MCK6271387.1 VOC family protein [Paenibacillus silvae]